MIEYNPGSCGLCFMFSLSGSVLPKAFAWALPNAVLAAILSIYASPAEGEESVLKGIEIIWSGYTFVLGFLLVFRNNQAYTRFWEGASLIQQIRGEWFNAYSSLISFASPQASALQVDTFQHKIARLISLLYCSALQQITELEDDTMEILECSGFPSEAMDFLQDANDRCEVILQWVQRSIVDANRDGAIDVAPPILSRVFQELSRGIVNLNSCRKIKEIPFPFPYAQTITYMLTVHWLVTPVIASQFMHSAIGAAVACFFTVCAYWAPMYIGMEIDQPFGADANDLPVKVLQADFNRSLLQLLDQQAQIAPEYTLEEDIRLDRISANVQPSQNVLHAGRNKSKLSISQRINYDGGGSGGLFASKSTSSVERAFDRAMGLLGRNTISAGERRDESRNSTMSMRSSVTSVASVVSADPCRRMSAASTRPESIPEELLPTEKQEEEQSHAPQPELDTSQTLRKTCSSAHLAGEDGQNKRFDVRHTERSTMSAMFTKPRDTSDKMQMPAPSSPAASRAQSAHSTSQLPIQAI
eukprot:TRINITY_DN23123_c0_g1_i1.p1 TRINITY_DN23123_c0_g1~~TRINITY_DN23123_c0_g1_i1.p1  ORF type:complete len:529 (-),score=69.21 TRINITY_DN23123_c0_g1_i1:223-1809(-)